MARSLMSLVWSRTAVVGRRRSHCLGLWKIQVSDAPLVERSRDWGMFKVRIFLVTRVYLCWFCDVGLGSK